MKKYLEKYLANRPLFLAFIRATEANIYERHKPLAGPELDVGCGDGFFVKTVFGRLDVGVDVADSRMRLAQAEGVDREMKEFDGVEIPVGSGRFGTVICNCTLEHVERLRPLLKEIYRTLKPGGVVLTTVMARPWEENLFGSMFLGNSYRNWMRKKQIHLNLLSRDGWRREFDMAGFKVTNEEGYLSPRACKWLDVFHYLSLPSLVYHTFTGKWVGWPNVISIEWLSRLGRERVAPDCAGAIFYALVKARSSRGE